MRWSIVIATLILCIAMGSDADASRQTCLIDCKASCGQKYNEPPDSKRCSSVCSSDCSKESGKAAASTANKAVQPSPCKIADSFRVVQKDGFTVNFDHKRKIATTKGYGQANISFVWLNKKQTKLRYTVYWKHGEPGVYAIDILQDGFGRGFVVTPGRNVSPVSFTTIDPVWIC